MFFYKKLSNVWSTIFFNWQKDWFKSGTVWSKIKLTSYELDQTFNACFQYSFTSCYRHISVGTKERIKVKYPTLISRTIFMFYSFLFQFHLIVSMLCIVRVMKIFSLVSFKTWKMAHRSLRMPWCALSLAALWKKEEFRLLLPLCSIVCQLYSDI